MNKLNSARYDSQCCWHRYRCSGILNNKIQVIPPAVWTGEGLGKMEKSVGTVKWFDNAKGYGFIVNEAGEDVFVHYRSIEGDGYKTLAEGQQVEYVQTKSDKGWQAAEVTRLE